MSSDDDDDDDDVLMMLIHGDGRSVYRCGESAADLSCLYTVSVVPVNTSFSCRSNRVQRINCRINSQRG